MAHRLIEAAEEARRMVGRGWHYCTDCERQVLVHDDYRCTCCGSGRTIRGIRPTPPDGEGEA